MSDRVDEVLGAVALVGSGITAGVLFSVAISLVPGFSALPSDDYVAAHKLYGRYFDRVMPPLVFVSTACCVAAAVLTDSAARRGLTVAAAAALFCVSVVSQTRNVPINRRVKSLDPGRMPADWNDPRTAWRTWHKIRTAAGLCALVLLAVASIPG